MASLCQLGNHNRQLTTDEFQMPNAKGPKKPQFSKSEWTVRNGRVAFLHSDFVIPLAFVIRVSSFCCGCAGRRTVFKAPLFWLSSRVTGSAARRLGNNHLQSGGGFVTCGA